MSNEFIPIPDWRSQENQGGGVAVAELSGTGQKDLIVFQIDNPPQLNRGLYKIGRNINADGVVTGGWTDWQQVPDWRSWENQGGGIAVAELSAKGQKDLIVFQIDNPPQLNQGLYKIGRNINADGVAMGGWTDWQQVPDWRSWENQGGAIAVADLTGNGQQDLIVFQIDNPPGQNSGLYKIGHGLNSDGVVTGGWSDWIQIPNWFSSENQGAGVTVVDLDNSGQKDIIIFQIDAPPQQNQAFFRIGKHIKPDGHVADNDWSPWYGVPSWFSFENQGGGIAAADLTGKGFHEMVVLMVDNPIGQNAGFYQVLPLDNDPKTQGTWELLPYDSEVLPVHAALLPGGKVLFAAGSGNNGVRFNSPEFGDITKNRWCSVVWDYTGSTPNQPKFFHPDTLRNAQGKVLDFFCGGETFLADGKLLTAGGTLAYDVDAHGQPQPGLRFTGRVETQAFDPITQQWTRLADMADGRWYPTLVTLGDGRVLIAAGLRKDGGQNRSLEVFTPNAGAGVWKELPLPPPNDFSQLPLYAHLFLMENGLIFFTGGRMDDGDISLPPCLLDITQNPIKKSPVGGLEVVDSRNQSTSVLLPPVQDQRVMIVGGAPAAGEGNATDSVDIINLSDAVPAYKPGPRLLLPRVHLNAVLLPDRTVFISGGALQREGGDTRKTTARFQSEIYDPLSNSWQLGATAQVARMYHSVALLLPDGKVVAASGNPDKGRQVAWEPPDPNEELRLEIYSPPYLFRGARPVIDNAPTEWKYGQTISIQSPQAGSIHFCSLIRNGVTTHSFNTGQRLVDLNIVSQGAGTIQATVTRNPNLAPPGWYMLFLTDNNRIPSVAKWIHLAA